MPARRFIFGWLWTAIALAVLMAIVNAVVDPYLLFDAPRRAAFNAVKPAVEAREFLMKAYQSRRVAAKTVILGSSRTDIAFDPASPVWPESMRPVYNLSLAGGGVETGLRYLEHMVDERPATQRPGALVVGLDFESFLEVPETEAAAPARPGALPIEAWRKRLLLDAGGRRNPAYEGQRFDDYVTGLVSLDALSDSLSTMLASRRPAASPNLEANGLTSEARFMNWTNAEGAAGLFRQKHEVTLRQYGMPRRVLAGLSERGELKSVRNLLDFARSQGMAVYLLVMPAHATRLELFDQMCYWGDYERWKRALAATTAAAMARGAEARVFDFGGFEGPIQEAVPNSRGARMKWFWDPVHPTRQLGDVMLQRTFAVADDGSGFGASLSPQTIDARLAAVRAARESYRQAHAERVASSAVPLCSTADCGVGPSCAGSAPQASALPLR